MFGARSAEAKRRYEAPMRSADAKRRCEASQAALFATGFRGVRLTAFFAVFATDRVFAAAFFAGGRARLATCADSASMRSISACTSRDDGTPSFFIAFAVRSSKIDSSLSHCLPAL